MTYEDMKRLGLSKYCAVPGEIYKRESDGKYFTVSEDGRKIEVTPEPGIWYYVNKGSINWDYTGL